MTRAFMCVFAALVALALLGCAVTVTEKKVVQVSYIGTLADGTIFDTTQGRKPLEFMIGGGFWIPAVEQALIGMKVGEKKHIVVKAADAFGEYNSAAVEEIPKDKFSDDIRFKKGLEVQTITSEGPTLARIIEVRPKTVIVDYNHPLAGKDLTFVLEILNIRNPTKEELDQLQKARQSTPQQ